MSETFNQMIRFPKDLEPQIKAQAEKNGVSVNQFVIGAVITALQPVQPQTVTEQPKETPVTGFRSPLNEKIALMQANERLHALQAKTAAERAVREHGCEFPYKSRVMGTSEPLKPLKAPYMARNPVKWGFFRLKGQEIPLKI